MTEQVQKNCPQCWRPETQCFCSRLRPFEGKIPVLVLQHPREAKNKLNSARLLSLSVANSRHRVGLSWRSLAAAWGKPAMPSEWAVLFAGTKKDQKQYQQELVTILDKKGKPREMKGIRGIVLLDGNWEQSKTLWWRNPWLTRLNRIVLNPSQPSLYGKLRKEPRKGLVSTLEAAVYCLDGFGESKQNTEGLLQSFQELLASTE